jgi:hypothetical protein
MMAYMMIIPEYPLRQPLDSVTEITVVLHMIISGLAHLGGSAVYNGELKSATFL